MEGVRDRLYDLIRGLHEIGVGEVEVAQRPARQQAGQSCPTAEEVEIALERARGAVPAGWAEARRTVLLAVGRGSSDPDANGDFCKMVRLLGETGGFAWSEPSFIGITTPLLEPAAERLALTAPERVLVLPYFLFDNGRLIERLAGQVRAFAARHPDIDVRLAPHLGGHARLLDLLEARLDEVLGGVAPLPCDTCPRSAAA